MKLFDSAKYEDYGREWFFQLLSHYPYFVFLDLKVQWDEFPYTDLFPILLFSIGNKSLCGFTFRYKWFELRLDFFQSAPIRNLKRYREKQP